METRTELELAEVIIRSVYSPVFVIDRNFRVFGLFIPAPMVFTLN